MASSRKSKLMIGPILLALALVGIVLAIGAAIVSALTAARDVQSEAVGEAAGRGIVEGAQDALIDAYESGRDRVYDALDGLWGTEDGP